LAGACNVPVFRYALERWPADNYEIIVFHEGPLTGEDRSIVEQLEKSSFKHIPHSNYTFQTIDISVNNSNKLLKLWESLETDELPCLVLLYPMNTGIRHDIWHGALSHETVQTLIGSPARCEMGDRILDGDSAVWILLESGNRAQDDAAAEMLETQLKKLEETLRLPEPVYGNMYTIESDVEVPDMKISLSMIRISRNDPAEASLINMLMNSEPDLFEYLSVPIAFPVYGRGRVLFSFIGDGINERNIQEACSFITGACSCEVKAINPGFDLLMMVDWDAGIKESWTAGLELPPLVGLSELVSSDDFFTDEESTTSFPTEIQNESMGMTEAADNQSGNLSKSGTLVSSRNLFRNIMITVGVIFVFVIVVSAQIMLRKPEKKS
jgi:hypothetical protein